MNNKQGEKTPRVASKSFMTVGPTLHYSHTNVQRCWLLSVGAFAVTCLLWSKILTGSFWSFNFQTATAPELWRLGRYITTGVSIFEYPWQILVLALLMGILAIVPVLVSQLMSFSYSLPFILAVAFFANLPAFAGCLLISCFAAACRPFRFRSRFTAIALCTAPQLVFWGCLGGAKGVEPIKWGFSFAPWICAWLIGLGIAGLVLGIGHFTRYRPGLVWIFTTVFLVLAAVTFEMRIGFDELDYQLYVAKNDPENVSEFHNHSITDALDRQIKNPTASLRRHVESRFYPAEPIPLRAKLKEEILTQLGLDRWPWWFMVAAEMNYQPKKQWLIQQYDLFINRRSKSRRMPIALYYKALLNEYAPDIMLLEQKEILHFYSDYPYERSQDIWSWLYTEFRDSPESLEARWRIAKRWAGQGRFEQADRLLAEARTMAAERLKKLEEQQAPADTLFSPFRPSPDSIMTAFKLVELQRRLSQLRSLIGPANRTGERASAERLARFVILNPHSLDYARDLDELLARVEDDDPLRDNILLAKVKLVADEQLRGERLARLHRELEHTDGGMHALYELGLLKIGLYQSESNPEQKRKYLADARATLMSFVSLYPDSFCAEQVKKNLDDLPTVD
ncbi:MAG: hypothetical protein ACYTEQ_09550 [Planctomycetota bacterium]|jgi:hypothetical protein